uniref:Major facilitator superfamily (MFS) profile domain-containing protein n=1 Tax=Graphocephala atropunctata TaxID=36148 RepID=A0A1B6MTM1_9HEMI
MENAKLRFLDEGNPTSTRIKNTEAKRVRLYLSVSILNMVFLICGTAFSWSSPVLIKLELASHEGSTVASMISLGMAFGPIISGALLNILGRKGTVGLSMGIMTASYLLLTVTRDVTFLSVARFLAGTTCGIAFSALPVYTAELAEDSVRGVLNTLSQIFISFGCLLMFSIGPFVSYAILHYVMLGLCATFFLLFPLLPESPYFLVMKNKANRARKTLAWLRQSRSPDLVAEELQSLQKSVQESQGESGSIGELFTCRANRRALATCCGLLILQQFSGITAIYFYMEQIFQMSGTDLPSSICSIAVGVIMTVASICCPIAVKHCGYKRPLIVSAFGAALGTGCLSMFFWLKNNNVDVSSLNWLPLVSVVEYILFFNSGFSIIPWALSGEYFPANVKSYATTIIASTCGLVSFVVGKFFPLLIDILGLEVLFAACSCFCFFTVLLVAFGVQETSGLSFQEIQGILHGRKREVRAPQHKL